MQRNQMKNGVRILSVFLWKMEGNGITAVLSICLTDP